MNGHQDQQTQSGFTQHDHDLLIELRTQQVGLRDDLRELKISLAETARLRREDDGEMDGRVRALENFRWWVLGAAAAAGTLGGIISRILRP